MMSCLRALAVMTPLVAVSLAPPSAAQAAGETKITPTPPAIDDGSVVLLVMVDRFADGADNAADVVKGHPRRFQGGDLQGLRARLPYLSSLGVSHLWLTPLHRQAPGLVGDGDNATAAYHGYWPEDFTAVDHHFGTAEDVSAFVDDAAKSGIGVIVDVVVNHTGYGAKDPRGLLRHPCGEGEVQGCLFGLPDLRTEDPRVRAAVVDDVRWWMRLAPFVGVRLDAFKHIDQPTAIAIRSGVHAERPGTMVIAERWGAGAGDAGVTADVAAGAADAAFDFGFMGIAQGFVSGRLRAQAAAHHLTARATALSTGPTSPPALHFLDNHDTETWAHAVGRRAPLGAPLLLLSPGIPVMTWGTELGRAGGAGDPENRSFMPWDVADDADVGPGPARDTLAFWRALVTLRRESAAVQSGTFKVVATSMAPATRPGFLVFERQNSNERVVVAIALGAPLRHCEPRHGRVALTLGWPSRPSVDEQQMTRCVDVEADSAAVFVARREAAPSTKAPADAH
jgi:alpha-amylase